MNETSPDPAPAPASQPPQRRRRRLSPAKKALFGLLTVTVLLGGTEIAFRIREAVRYSRRHHISPRIPDTYRNMVLDPGVHWVEESLHADINSLGMRDHEVGEKAPGTLRVLCIGGSTTYGLFTTRNEFCWPKQLEQRLHEAGYTNVEVLNGGVPAWDLRTSQTNLELRLYEHVQPDVVICYHAYNDLVANADPGYWESSKVEDVGELWQPLQGSAFARFLFHYLKDPGDELVHKHDHLEDAGAEAFERNLRRFVRRTREEGARPFFCTYPSALRPTYEESKRDKVPGLERWFDELSPFTYPALYGGLQRYNVLIRKVASDEGIPYCELAEQMPHDVKYYTSTVHHSDEGEGLVAGFIADALVKSGILGGKPE